MCYVLCVCTRTAFRCRPKKEERTFLISSFRRVLYVVCYFLGNYPAFRNTLFHLYRQVDLPAYEDGTECSETSAFKLQTPNNYP
jgi:hypothetical protein